MSIKLVVFDIAGTTVRDENYVAIGFQKAMGKYGYNLDIDVINPIMGYEKPLAIEIMLKKHEVNMEKITDKLILEIHEEFVRSMIGFYLTAEIMPLPGVEETFKNLKKKGIKIGLDTGFSKDIADIIMDRLEWRQYVDYMVASDEVSNGRPFPDMINKIMEYLGVQSATEVAKVGDTEADVNEGINARCKYVIGVTTGAFKRHELEPYRPTHIIDHISEIESIICG
jgi:phosphonatase-like hydrolase